MKKKVTIDKLVASSQENAAPPPPDPDLMWADMAKRLDAAAPPASASDPHIAAGPGPASAAKQATTIITWLVVGLAGVGALFAIVSRPWPAGSERTSLQIQENPASSGEDALLTELLTAPSGNGEGSEIETAVPAVTAANAIKSVDGAYALKTNALQNTQGRRGTLQGTALQGASRIRAEKTEEYLVTGPGRENRTSAGTAATVESLAKATAVDHGAGEFSEKTAGLFSADSQTADPDAVDRGESILAGQRAMFSETPVLSLSPAFIELPPRLLEGAAVKASSTTSPSFRQGFILYAGSSIGKTPRVYQNFTPTATYLNLGIGYRLVLSRRWSFQPELWLTQLETPRLSIVTEQRLDLDGERLLQYDTVSVMRMQGIGINLMIGAELPAGFTLVGGPHLSRYAKVMTEQSFGTRSLVNNSLSWGYNFSRGYSAAPDWFQVYQAGVKLGLEKRFRQRVIVGFNVYQGLSDLYGARASGPANLPNSWVVYAGYRL